VKVYTFRDSVLHVLMILGDEYSISS